MRRLSTLLQILLVLISINFTACHSDSLEGKKLYLLSLTVETVPMMKEIECNFIDPDKVEVKETLFGYAGTFKTVKTDSSIYVESKILTYSYKDGFLEIPELNLTARLTEDAVGNYETNTNETFYKQSIVDILNTQEAKDRIIKASPMANITSMYLDMLKDPSNGGLTLTMKNGVILSSNTPAEQSNMPMDTSKMDTLRKGGVPTSADSAAAKKQQEAEDLANGTKPYLTLNDMIEFVKRDNFTIPEIEKYLSQICTLKMKLDPEGSKIDFSENGNDMEYDPYDHTFSITYSDNDYYPVIIKRLNKKDFKKTILKPGATEVSNTMYQSRNYNIDYVQTQGGSMGNSPCIITISRASTFKPNSK